MSHPRCRAPDCNRRILPGQRVVCLPREGRGLSIWMHDGHPHAPMLTVTYHDDLDTIAVRRQLMRVWEEKHRPEPGEPGRRRFDEACMVQIADIRTRVRPERRRT